MNELLKDTTTLTLCVIASDLADLMRESLQTNKAEFAGLYDWHAAISKELERRFFEGKL